MLAVRVLIFEPSVHRALKPARKDVGIFQVQVCKRKSMGLNPDAGVSAVDAIAHMVLEL